MQLCFAHPLPHTCSTNLHLSAAIPTRNPSVTPPAHVVYCAFPGCVHLVIKLIAQPTDGAPSESGLCSIARGGAPPCLPAARPLRLTPPPGFQLVCPAVAIASPSPSASPGQPAALMPPSCGRALPFESSAPYLSPAVVVIGGDGVEAAASAALTVHVPTALAAKLAAAGSGLRVVACLSGR